MISEIFLNKAFKRYEEEKDRLTQLSLLPKMFKNDEIKTITVGFNNITTIEFTLHNNTLYFDNELVSPDVLINKKDIKNALKDFCLVHKMPEIDYIMDIPHNDSYYYKYDSKNNGKLFYLYSFNEKLIITRHLLPLFFRKLYESRRFDDVIEYVTDNYNQFTENIVFTKDSEEECVEYYYLYPYRGNIDVWAKLKQKYITNL